MDKKKATKHNLLVVVLLFGILLLLSLGLFLYKTWNKFSYQKSLDDRIVSVNQQEVTLRQFGYYVLLMEKDTQETALTYDADQPMNYWNLYIGTEEKVGYVSNLAREYALEYCIRDLVYQDEMIEADYTFSVEQLEEMKSEAYQLLESFSQEQLVKVGMTEEDFLEEAVCVAKVHCYLETLTDGGIMSEELDITGEYYNELKAQKQISVNEELVSKLSFGSITVN